MSGEIIQKFRPNLVSSHGYISSLASGSNCLAIFLTEVFEHRMNPTKWQTSTGSETLHISLAD